MRREELLPYIEEIVTVLRPACERIEIAGGIRRGKPEPHDAEIVCLPKVLDGLFGDSNAPTLEEVITRCINSDKLAWDMRVKRNGRRYKRFVLPRHPDVPLDLFIADADNYGNTLAIRTGDSDFSLEMMVQAWRHGMRQEDGYLWQWPDGARFRVSSPTEADFFRAIGWPVVPPEDRNKGTALGLKRKVA